MPRERNGFTLLEVVVTVAIVGLLMALLIPAVQQSRASARSLECTNRLKQIGIALHTFQSAHGFYPAYSYGHESIGRVYQAMGYTIDEGRSRGRPPEAPRPPRDSPVFRCPADAPPAGGSPSFSYIFSAGTAFRAGPDQANGYFPGHGSKRSPQDITDGLSQTAAVSERLLITSAMENTDSALAHPRRFLWWTQTAIPRVPGNEPLVVEACKTQRTSPVPAVLYSGASVDTGYDHRLPPNRYGCWNGPVGDAYMFDPVAPATSMHPGGVNVLFADGHVQFIADGIDETLWRALGSINGGESQAASAFQ